MLIWILKCVILFLVLVTYSDILKLLPDVTDLLWLNGLSVDSGQCWQFDWNETHTMKQGVFDSVIRNNQSESRNQSVSDTCSAYFQRVNTAVKRPASVARYTMLPLFWRKKRTSSLPVSTAGKQIWSHRND